MGSKEWNKYRKKIKANGGPRSHRAIVHFQVNMQHAFVFIAALCFILFLGGSSPKDWTGSEMGVIGFFLLLIVWSIRDAFNGPPKLRNDRPPYADEIDAINAKLKPTNLNKG